MVGAGFSRNAEKVRSGTHDSPTWNEVAEAIHNKLYPRGVDDEGQRTGIVAASETRGLLRLAQEYEAAFGRGDLHKFIGELIRDEAFKPGDMHARLLRLPWRDVFTTNWDTLLERARSSVIEYPYGVVCNIEEIPLAKRPRIVKLHGSFPAHFPLILTEEDYRTYPVKFAPFVNTVQQAMMETVFCLIGFSGDDPNFLHWSGWVRDNLGSAAPKVYLMGWLDLSLHRRRMLEDQNIVVIDLAHHPKAHEWPEHLRHRYATDWILRTLELGRPYEVFNWPFPSNYQYLQPPEYLKPVLRVTSDEPNKIPSPPQSENGPRDPSAPVLELLNVWSHNRKVYPGWLAVPISAKYELSQDTKKWESLILDTLQNLAPVDRLKAIYELIWLKEVLLEPVSLQIETAAKEVLKEIDCENQTIKGTCDNKTDWADIRQAWCTVAFALVSLSRQRFDHSEFDGWIESLLHFCNDDQDVSHRIYHERCLLATYSLDFEALENLINSWNTEDCDPVWKMRKSAFLFEIGQNDAAEKLIETALAMIRKNPDDDRTLGASSREGWAMWSALSFKDFDHSAENWSASFDRWGELTRLKCNAFMEIHRYTEAIVGSHEKRSGPPFDLGVEELPGISFSNAEYDQWVAAHSAIRLTEVAGLPPYNRHLGVASNILGLAAEKLSIHEPELSARLVLRISKYDGDNTLKHVLSRTRVATMPVDSVKSLVGNCLDAIEYVLPRIFEVSTGLREIFWIERLRVFMEVLSRFVVRLEPEMVETVFKEALKWYENSHVAGDFLLQGPMRSVLKRSWETLPESHRINHVLDMLSTPICGMDGFTAFDSRYLDPGELLLSNRISPPRTNSNESRWQEIVRLVVHGLGSIKEARRRASVRMIGLLLMDQITDDEKSQLTLALWGKDYANHNNLPRDTGLKDWSFLQLSEPELGIAEQRFRQKWLNSKISNKGDNPSLDDILWNIGSAISGLKTDRNQLTFSDNERDYLATLVTRWSEVQALPPEQHSLIRTLTQRDYEENVRKSITGLKWVLLETQVSEPAAKKLYEKVQTLKNFDVPVLGLTAGLIKALPECFDQIVLSMKMGLVSEKDRLARDAASGLWFWLRIAKEDSRDKINHPPDDLIREIGIIIATRRKVVLIDALRIARWIFSKGHREQRDVIAELVLQGLGYLAQELRYENRSDQDAEIDVPLLRWGCTHLALSMARCGLNENPTIAHWVESAENDPLPEVRNAKNSEDI